MSNERETSTWQSLTDLYIF